ncbi:MAG: hypothetical protein R6U26_00700 [Candidatus Undinarchaeales archaeon]
MAKSKKFWKLLIINTLDSIQEIDTVVEGLVVGIFGILLGIAGFCYFGYIGLTLSAEISLLAVFAYLAVSFYHIYAYERDKKRADGSIGRVVERSAEILILLIAIMVFYVLIFEQILTVRSIADLVRNSRGLMAVMMKSLPGLAVLVVPLFGWEWFAEKTPTDDILKKVFKK